MKQTFILILLVLSMSMLFADGVQPVGTGTEEDPYLIATLDNLLYLSTNQGLWLSGIYFLQTADIDASATQNWNDGAGWDPIGNSILYDIPFSGNYNGQMYTISNLFINRPDEDYVGLWGCLDWADLQNIKIENITSIGSEGVGGLVGCLEYQSSVSICSATGLIQGESNVGGLIGILDASSTISDCFSLCNIIGYTNVYGLAGCDENTYHNIINSYYNYQSVLINSEHVVTIGALNADMFNEWIINGYVLDINDYLVFENENYIISSVNDFHTLLAFGHTNDTNFLLTNDLDFTLLLNYYIPYFKGNFDGQNHKILNLCLDYSDTQMIGLFGYLSNSSIYNLGLENVQINGKKFVGCLAGKSVVSSISNCYCIGNINADNIVGGLIGYNDDSPLFESNYFIGNVIGVNSNIGGLIGENHNSTIFHCRSNAIISGLSCVGGLIGWSQGSNISQCYSYSYINDSLVMAGNLVGINCNSSTISNSFCFGSMTTTSTDRTGSLVGWNFLNSTIDKCYCNVSVNLETVAGLVGCNTNNSIVLNSFWNISTSGQTTSAGGEGRTTDEMTYPYAENTYVGWDFELVWLEDVNYEYNNGYPYIREDAVVDIDDDELITQHSALKISNYPNPFNPSTTISFTTTKSTENTKIEIFNIKGQKVKELLNEVLPAGEHSVVWNGKDDSERSVASGVYFTRLSTNGKILTRKMMMIK